MTQIEAILYKNKYEPFADCSAFVTSEVLNWDSVSELYLTVPNRLNNTDVLMFNEVRKNRYIVVDDTRRYIIKEINTVKNSEISEKQIKCYSAEYMLEFINIEIPENEPFFFQDIADLITELTGWKFEIRTKNLDLGACYSVSGNYKVLTFLRETLQKLYDVHFYFDTVKNKIIVLDKTYNYSVYGDWDNLLQSITINDTENIVTRLRNTDESCAIFAEDIKCAGKEYIEDFSYFIANGLISNSLVQQLEKYDSFLDSKQSEFDKLQNNLFKLDAEVKTIESEIEELESVDTAEQEKDSEALARLETRKEELKTEITTAEDKILAFGEKVSRENSGIFSKESLLELNEIIVEEDFQSNNETSSKDRYDAMVRQLKQINKAKFEYSLDIPTVKHIIERLGTGSVKLGSLFYFSEKVGIDNLRLISYTIDYINDDINNLVFANSYDEPTDKLDFFGQIIDETKRLQRKTNKVKITVERLEDGFKSQVTKGQFWTTIAQTYNYIEGEVNSESICTKVRQEADKFGISIDGKLDGANYTFDSENATFTGAGLIVKNDDGKVVLYVNDKTGKLTCDSLEVLNGNVNFKSPKDSDSLFVNFYRGSSTIPSRIGIYAIEGANSGINRGNQLFIEPSNPDTSKMPMVIFRGARSTKDANDPCVVQIIGELQAQEMQLGFSDDAINIRATLADLKNRVAELEAKLT